MTSFDVQSPLPARRPILDSDEKVEKSEEAVAPVVAVIGESVFDTNQKPDEKKRAGFNIPIFLWIGLALLLLLIIFLVIFRVLIPNLKGTTPTTPTKLIYWGMWEPSQVMNSVLDEFAAAHPGVNVVYEKQEKRDYRNRLQARLGKSGEANSGEVPDVFRIHSSWLPMMKNNLAKMPGETATKIGLGTDYYKVFEELKSNGSYLAVPLMYDNLSLFYNKSIIESAQASLPKTWWGFEKLARKLTVKDANGNITTAGAAMGLTGNVDHWSDIIGLLLQQKQVEPFKADKTNGDKLNDVLQYYSLFRTKDAVWDETLANSTQTFANGRLGLYFGPSWRVFDIQAINPDLAFEVTNVPQLPTLEYSDKAESIENGQISGGLSTEQWATYWVEGVNNQSKNQKLAWELLAFLSQKENLQKMYGAAASLRSFGEIYPRKSMKDSLASDKRILPFLQVADSAKSWYLSSFTYDTGLNDEMSKYFEDAINSITIKNNQSADILPTLQNGLLQLQNRYKLTVNP